MSSGIKGMGSGMRWSVLACTCLITPATTGFVTGSASAQAPAPARQLGTVRTIEGSTVTITTAAGAPITVTIAPDATVLQLPPGSTDLKSATPSNAASISVGDRILASGKPGDSAAAITASRVVLMKSSDIAARNQAQQADWQKRGISGLVKAVDGDVLTIGVGQRTVKVQTTSGTTFRRYAADSVNFQDAKVSSLGQIQVGDQLTARGAHSEDNSAITAEEVVTGTFANLSGVLTAVDSSAGTVALKDLATRRSVTVKVTSNSDLRGLPPQAATMFASRNATGGGAAASAGSASARTSNQAAPGGSGEGRARAGMDLSRMLARLPSKTLADVKPGEAVMIVASEGGSSNTFTAITLLTGVEQILSSNSAGAQPITLSPWTIGAPEGGGGPQ